ncbi:unnamed protein product [Caenorhabditis bovis]|uniref:guanylate cyclase n=1 Tax=Caenorhabditis bovis TaxID=2654633 RepID=A0A8S1FBM4_9PELO|nr:unnamed protein product [Caenorhabditis bovis]
MWLVYSIFCILTFISYSDSFTIGHLEFVNSNESKILQICLGPRTEHRLISLDACNNFNGLENAANLNYHYKVDLLIGASCDEETETVSRLALRWHKIYLSSAPLSTKEKEETTIALKAHSVAGNAEMIIGMCRAMGWREIGILYSEETKYNAHAIYDNIASKHDININVFLETDGYINTYPIINEARVLISFMKYKHLAQFVETLRDKAVRPLEYSIIQIDDGIRPPEEFFRFLDHQASIDTNEIEASRLRKMHTHIALVRNIHENMTNVNKFATKYHIPSGHTLYKALILCDGLQLLSGYVRNENDSTIEELPSLWAHMTNTEVSGYTGPMFIGYDGIRRPYYEMFFWRNKQVHMVAVARPKQIQLCETNISNCYEFSRMHNGHLLDELPPYYSECGYDNSLCSDSHVFIIAAIVFTILLIPLAIALYLQRKEHLIQKMPWRVPLESLNFNEGNHSQMVSMNRRMSNSTQRISHSSILTLSYCEQAMLNKQKVKIKRFIQRRAITFSRCEMEMLNELKFLSHSNINTFSGICFNQGSELLVLWAFAARLSLEDLIFGKEQKFGRNFQSTFLKHIISGLNYIHNSSIKFHGALYLSNCVVDSYWVVKLTDFGIRSVFHEKFLHKELVYLNNFDVEAIHFKYLQLAPEHLAELLEKHEEPIGSQIGDIYQLAMCIYQILFYMRPFAERQESINEIAQLINKTPSSIIHPSVPEGASFTMRLLSIMQQCWLHKPSARPTLVKIMDAVNREFGQEAKGSLIDQMIEMIDEYSANMEQIVAERTMDLENQMSKTENLLYQLLPKSMADAIRDGRTVSPEQHPAVTLLVVDICQFTKFCEAFIPVHILETLQELYSSFDYIVQKNKAFKVENVGDAYLICCGIPEMPGHKHLREICKISLKLQTFMKTFTVRHRPNHKLDVKMGVTTGAVAAGILGSIAPRFCIFGDTVNMCCRMASTSLPGKIQINELTGNTLKEKFPSFILEERGMVDVKGKGPCLTYWLNGEKDIKRQPSRTSQIKFEEPNN